MEDRRWEREQPIGAPIFRMMRLDDIPLICEIEQEAFTTPWSAGAFHNELTSNHFAHYIVMLVDGVVAGYAGMWLIMDEAHVTNIAISGKYRGRKLGEVLVRQMQHKARSLGAVRMTLEVRASNFIAQRLYDKMGFKYVGVRKGYYTDNNEDAIIMWAELPEQDQPA
ncbi:ribosomal protein S18-alanine N-acetyltransferase [Paenibacillus sp. FJAT-26967]|uniref:ribosomal protein S18-alanine N-acetyltransferase n=1 Tax=Paenibacillus sp. FJAT-26967 TaxID=1729690 RepID=UPI00083905CC|nr:ribosomal protein S18-alanine N-acetyltransferase [Paenibacillus sp. FJAT-26967]